MKDNFDLKKFLTENKIAENSNPYLKPQNEKEETLRKHIREMIQKEIAGINDEDYELEDRKITYGINPELEDDYINPGNTEEEAEERKKYLDDFGMPPHMTEAKEEEEAEEDTTEEETEEEVDITDEEGGEEAPESDITDGANLEGVAGEMFQGLMDIFVKSKEMGNEDFTTQVSNTARFLVKIATEPKG